LLATNVFIMKAAFFVLAAVLLLVENG